MMKKKPSEMTKKTIRYILVYLICLILAFSTWLLVMYSERSEELKEGNVVGETLQMEQEDGTLQKVSVGYTVV